MKLYVQPAGKGRVIPVTLDPTHDFVFKGGEKTVYRKGDTAYAVYHDPAAATPPAKLSELAVLTDPRIVKPKDQLLDEQRRHVGETMDYVGDARVLVQLFPKAFRDRTGGPQPAEMLELIRKLQGLVKHVHGHRILIVDLREMNFLVRNDFADLYAIDVPAWHTPGFSEPDYGKCLIGPMHRDRHARHPSQESDWFSFAVIACQMAFGFHPYLGNHPDYTGAQDEVLNRRFLDHVSIFNPKTVFPKRACYPFDVVPAGLRGWLEAVLERGERSAPPERYDGAVVIRVAQLPDLVPQQYSGAFQVQQLFTAAEPILAVYYGPGWTRVIKTTGGYYLNDTRYAQADVPQDAHCVFSDSQPYWAYIADGKLRLAGLHTGIPVTVLLDLNARLLVSYEGRLIFVNRTQAMELSIRETATGPRTSTQLVGQVLDVPDAIRAYDGVLVQNMLGRYHCTVFPAPGKSRTVKLPELDGTQVLDAKYSGGVLMLLASDDRVYNRYLVRCSPDHDRYDLQVARNVPYTGINFTTIDSGVFLAVDHEGNLQFGSARCGSTSPIRTTSDPLVDTGVRLEHHGNKVLLLRDTALYQISMK